MKKCDKFVGSALKMPNLDRLINALGGRCPLSYSPYPSTFIFYFLFIFLYIMPADRHKLTVLGSIQGIRRLGVGLERDRVGGSFEILTSLLVAMLGQARYLCMIGRSNVVPAWLAKTWV